LFAAVIFVATTTAQQPQGRGQGPTAPLALKQIKPGLYMVGLSGGNSVFRVTNNGIVLVDTKVPGEAYYKQLMDLIRVVSDQPVRYVVVTHVHIDHSGNIESFVKNGAQVVAHENFVKNLETYTPAAAAKPGKPNVTYSRDYSIRLGDTEVAHVYHFASGHTSGDSIVHFPDLGVVAMGDELQLPGVVCDYGLGGSIPGWAQSINEVLKLNFDLAVPGHIRMELPFAPVSRADLVALKAKLDSVTKNAIELVKKGTPKDQLIAQIQAADANATVGAMLQNIPTRIDLFYEEISKLAK
jgi:glyoxylase-like metal-dependent hydrolase (beta-lactamase superfamily II)